MKTEQLDMQQPPISAEQQIPQDVLMAQTTLEASAQLEVQPLHTGAELVAQLEARIPASQRERLREIGNRFDKTMGDLAQPPSVEKVAQATGFYVKAREGSFNNVATGRDTSPETRISNPTKKDDTQAHEINIGHARNLETLFPKADPATIRRGVEEQVDIRPRTVTLGEVTVTVPGMSEQSSKRSELSIVKAPTILRVW
jgi:hypothetical protein